MNVLVTGAAGFLGSHIAKWHLDHGDQVTGVDDHSSSKPDSRHLRELVKHKDFNFYRESTVGPIMMAFVHRIKDDQFNLIYNFGCPASPPMYQQKSIHTLDTCFNGTRHILMIAVTHKARVVHASTSEVYGDPNVTPQKESYWGNVNSFGPRSCYDEGKRVAEALCYEYHEKMGVDVRMVRIFNTYGPHMDPDDGRVITNFIKQALAGDDITVYGAGTQTRSFCYVSDLVEGITRLGCLADCTVDSHLPINLGNPREFTILELARKVIEVTNSASRIVFNDLPVDDPMQRCPDIHRAEKLLDHWRPKIDLDTGLRATVEYLRNNH